MNQTIADKLKNLPKSSGVYVMHSSSGAVIYVGKAKNLKNRVSSYFQNSPKPPKVNAMINNIADFEYFVTLSERDAFALESNLIKKYKPFYNILLKDDKAFPYIKINLKEEYPRFEVVRKISKSKNIKYFGPYISSISPYALIKAINFAFPVRTCKNLAMQKSVGRACLNYSLGLCSAPCMKYVDKATYRTYIDKAMDFLKGNDKEIYSILEQKMISASNAENFEHAIEIRDLLKMIDALKQKVVANMPTSIEVDVFSLYSNYVDTVITVLNVRGGKILGVCNYPIINVSLNDEQTLQRFIFEYYDRHKQIPNNVFTNIEVGEFCVGENNITPFVPQKGVKFKLIQTALANGKEFLEKSVIKQTLSYEKTVGALEKLKEKLNLPKVPNRIECYDISNISGTNKVASMTVFVGGKPSKENYRKFKIKYVEGQNDFECLKETLSRRIKELDGKDNSFSCEPDLIVIDGGKGQLSSAMEVLKQMGKNFPIISLAEKFDEVFVPNCSNPIMLKRASFELRILQNIRDEAHRFAITFHRSLRTKSMLHSPLDDIKGLGQVKKKALLDKFETIEQIKQASVSDLCLIKGINEVLATSILKYLNNN